MCAAGSLRVSSFLPAFGSTALVPEECIHTCVTDGADPSAGGGGCHGAVSTREDAEGIVQKGTLLKGELTEVHQARRWPRRSYVACPPHRLMVHGDWWSPRWSTKSSFRSFPFYELRAPSCIFPLLAHHGQGITYWRGCGPLPSTILKWPGSLPCFGR
jgi:hypothetical protein